MIKNVTAPSVAKAVLSFLFIIILATICKIPKYHTGSRVFILVLPVSM